jgi:hypothetical protein
MFKKQESLAVAINKNKADLLFKMRDFRLGNEFFDCLAKPKV